MIQSETMEPYIHKETLYLVDMNSLLKSTDILNYDIWRLVASLQGVVNKKAKELQALIYLLFDEEDSFWLDFMHKKGRMFSHAYSVQKITTWEEYLRAFTPLLKALGVILWDPQVPATSNLCATLCGIDGCIPVKYDPREGSLYHLLQLRGIPCDERLVGLFTGKGTVPGTTIPSSGSAKCDAYLWALENLIDKTAPEIIAYMPDGASCVEDNEVFKRDGSDGHISCLPNHDYLIARGAFFFDLSPVEDEVPCDDPTQPLGADSRTMQAVLQRIYERNEGRITYDVGFIHWWLKYTRCHDFSRYTENQVETLLNDRFSMHNIVMECDAAQPCWMTNASVYHLYPQRDSYPNHKPKTIEAYDPNTVYLLAYIGDYDSSAWFKKKIFPLWEGKTDASRPMMWSFDGNLLDRSAPIFDYIYDNINENDYFTTGNSGCGNINPSRLLQGNGGRTLPDGTEAWYTFCKRYYDKFHHDITGFLINGLDKLDPRIMDLYHRLSPVGVLHNDLYYTPPLTLYKGTPFVHVMNGNGLEIDVPLRERVNAAAVFLFSSRLGHGQNF